MGVYEVLKRVNLTVEPGSQVILSEEQYKVAKGYVTAIRCEDTVNINIEINDNPTEISGKPLNKMTKAELLAIAAKKGLEIANGMTNAAIVELLEKQV